MGPRSLLALVFAAASLIACQDDPKPLAPIDASVDAGSCDGTAKLFETCLVSADCESCLCKSFGHAILCTQSCETADDCPDGHPCDKGICQPQ